MHKKKSKERIKKYIYMLIYKISTEVLNDKSAKPNSYKLIVKGFLILRSKLLILLFKFVEQFI